jgi:hypothetical protein
MRERRVVFGKDSFWDEVPSDDTIASKRLQNPSASYHK